MPLEIDIKIDLLCHPPMVECEFADSLYAMQESLMQVPQVQLLGLSDPIDLEYD